MAWDWESACNDFYDLFRHDAVDTIKELKFYLKTIEEFISKEEKTEAVYFKNKINSLKPEKRDAFLNSFYDPVDWDEIFRKQLRTSLITLGTSRVEWHLKHICQQIKIIVPKEIRISRSDLRGHFLDASKMYLECFGDFNEPKQEKWDLLKQIYYVRNCLVHHIGNIENSEKRDEIEKLVRRNVGIKIDSYSYIKIDSSFGEFFLDTINDFLDTLYIQFKNLCENRKSWAIKHNSK